MKGAGWDTGWGAAVAVADEADCVRAGGHVYGGRGGAQGAEVFCL